MKSICNILMQDLWSMISAESPQELLTRTCTRSCRDLLEDFTGISTRACRKDLCKIMQWPLTAFHWHLHLNFLQGPDTRTSQEPSTSKDGTCKDLWERIWPGSPLLRTCTGSCKDLLERNAAGSPQEPVYARIYNEKAADQESWRTLRCAVDMHMDMTEEAVFARRYNKNAPDQDRYIRFCASLRGRNHMSISKSNCTRECVGQNATPQEHRFVRACAVEMHMNMHVTSLRSRNPACAVEMHMDMSEEQFYAGIYRKNDTPQEFENPAVQTLCEPVKSKWTCHKRTN